jgi:DNA processing protein
MAKDVGPVRIKALLDYFKTPENIFRAGIQELMGVAGIGKNTAENILRVSEDKRLLDKERKLIERYKVKVVTVFDEDYPQILKQIYDPPVVLYIKGELKAVDKTSIAIVGSRRCTYYGRDTATRLAAELASLGITVTSGMARGIDTAAHNGALDAGGRTIAVLGSGLANIYPPENIRLAERIADSGAVISEFPMTMPPLSENFPRRNRIISGLSLGTVVVEAAEDSGALITTRCALEQGREVFSVPGQAGSAVSKGTNQLIRDGAKLVETAKDILEELAPALRAEGVGRSGQVPRKTVVWPEPVPCSRSVGTCPDQLKPDESKIIQLLANGPMQIDSIANETLIPITAVSSALTTLEMKGLIKRMPGNIFYRQER